MKMDFIKRKRIELKALAPSFYLSGNSVQKPDAARLISGLRNINPRNIN